MKIQLRVDGPCVKQLKVNDERKRKTRGATSTAANVDVWLADLIILYAVVWLRTSANMNCQHLHRPPSDYTMCLENYTLVLNSPAGTNFRPHHLVITFASRTALQHETERKESPPHPLW